MLPFAPKSEFAFLLILALVCAYITRQLGVYYLVGAFLVGVTAVRLRRRLPVLASERLTSVSSSSLTLVLVAVPLRVLNAAVHRQLALGEPFWSGVRVGLSLVPTLVFTIVLADILRERFQSAELYGALMVRRNARRNASILPRQLRPAATHLTTAQSFIEHIREGSKTGTHPSTPTVATATVATNPRTTRQGRSDFASDMLANSLNKTEARHHLSVRELARELPVRATGLATLLYVRPHTTEATEARDLSKLG